MLTKEQKIEAINARRQTLAHEQYGAELDVATAREGRNKDLCAEPEARLEEVNRKLAALDKEEAAIK